MKPQRLQLIIVFLAMALVVPCAWTGLSTAAAQGRTGKSLKDVGTGMKQLGRKIGHAGKEVGREVADGARKVWYKGLRVSEPLLKDVQKQTRRYWAEMIAGKERTLRELERENKQLRKRLAEKENR